MKTHALDVSEETSFGSSARSLQNAASILRAKASCSGVVLLETSPIDLAASVIGADAWVRVLDGSFTRAGSLDKGAASALSRILLRSAGRAVDNFVEFEDCEAAEAFLMLAMSHARWAQNILSSSEDAVEALKRAARDLFCTESKRLASFATLLFYTAEGLNGNLYS